MATRTQRKTVAFGHPFRLKGVDRVLPPGDYEVLTDEELIEGLSFPVYHRVSTAIIVPAQSHQASSVEMVVIDPPRPSGAGQASPQCVGCDRFRTRAPRHSYITSLSAVPRPRPSVQWLVDHSIRPSRL